MARQQISQSALARELGVTQQALSRRLNGDVAFDTNDLEQIADALHVSPGQFLLATPGDPIVDRRPVGRVTEPAA